MRSPAKLRASVNPHLFTQRSTDSSKAKKTGLDVYRRENKAVEQGPRGVATNNKNGNWKLRIVVMSWSIDKAKLDRVRTLMKDQDISALVCRAPDNVLYLTNYWCMKGYDAVVFPV